MPAFLPENGIAILVKNHMITRGIIYVLICVNCAIFETVQLTHGLHVPIVIAFLKVRNVSIDTNKM